MSSTDQLFNITDKRVDGLIDSKVLCDKHDDAKNIICKHYLSRGGCDLTHRCTNSSGNEYSVSFCKFAHVRLRSKPFDCLEAHIKGYEGNNQRGYAAGCYFLNFLSKVSLIKRNYVENPIIYSTHLFSLIEDFLMKFMNVRSYAQYKCNKNSLRNDVTEHFYDVENADGHGNVKLKREYEKDSFGPPYEHWGYYGNEILVRYYKSPPLVVSSLLNVIERLGGDCNYKFIPIHAATFNRIRNERNKVTHEFVEQYINTCKSLEDCEKMIKIVDEFTEWMRDEWIPTHFRYQVILKRHKDLFALQETNIQRVTRTRNFLPFEELGSLVGKKNKMLNILDFHCGICFDKIFSGEEILKVRKSEKPSSKKFFVEVKKIVDRNVIVLEDDFSRRGKVGLHWSVYCKNCEGHRSDGKRKNEGVIGKKLFWEDMKDLDELFYSFDITNHRGRFNIFPRRRHRQTNVQNSSDITADDEEEEGETSDNEGGDSSSDKFVLTGDNSLDFLMTKYRKNHVSSYLKSINSDEDRKRVVETWIYYGALSFVELELRRGKEREEIVPKEQIIRKYEELKEKKKIEEMEKKKIEEMKKKKIEEMEKKKNEEMEKKENEEMEKKKVEDHRAFDENVREESEDSEDSGDLNFSSEEESNDEESNDLECFSPGDTYYPKGYPGNVSEEDNETSSSSESTPGDPKSPDEFASARGKKKRKRKISKTARKNEKKKRKKQTGKKKNKK